MAKQNLEPTGNPAFDQLTDLFDTFWIHENEFIRNKLSQDVKALIVQGKLDRAIELIARWGFMTGVLVGRGDMKVG